ncbi:MAG: hypothetical protein OXQ32_05035 [bacterium]|nr:hypothetical protein [bacterium]
MGNNAAVVLAAVAGGVATAATLDLARDLRSRPRPHLSAYTAGMAMFAIAVWALFSGLGWGWTGLSYRVFFLFGGVLNIPFLALGSVFLSVGRRIGHIMVVGLFGFSAMATTLVSVTPFARPLPEGGIPADIFPSIAEAGFGPRLLAPIAGGLGTLVLVTAALWGAVRFRKSNPRRAAANLVITGGVLAAATGGTILGFLHESSGFSVSLLTAASLIWWGYRLASDRRPKSDP